MRLAPSTVLALVGVGLNLLALTTGPAHAEPLQVVATVPDLASLVREVGGDQVSVEALARGSQDPHYLEPRPSFIRQLHRADLFVLVGMDLEVGWAPVLLQSARNREVMPGARAHLDASLTIDPLEISSPGVDRSAGDLHRYGNPHYLTDPMNGLRVAGTIRDKLIELRPESAALFRERHADFVHRLLTQLVGAEIAEHHPAEELVQWIETGQLTQALEERREVERLGGWLGAVRPFAGTRAVEDHRFWAYFARRFGLELVMTLEPFPGIAPTTRHLAGVVDAVRAQQVPIILSTVYFDPRHARWVSERTGARVVPLAHQVGAREGSGDYLAAIDYNVRQLVRALGPS